MNPNKHTYAEFLHPSDEQIGTVEYSLREVSDRDPTTPPGPPSDAIGVRFFDQIIVESFDHALNRNFECKSERFSQSTGTIFFGNKVKLLTPAEVQSGSDIPAFMKTLVLANIANNGWKKIVFASGVVLPFDPAKDQVV